MSTSSRLFEMIANLTEDEVRADLNRVRVERERLEIEEALLHQVLDLVKTGHTSIDQSIERRTHLAKLSRDRAEAELEPVVPRPVSNGEPQRAPRQNRRHAITAIMRADPERSWSNADMHKALTERGADVTPVNVRVTLQRMERDGELVRVGRGVYKLPSERSLLSAEAEELAGPGAGSPVGPANPAEASRDASQPGRADST